MDYNYWISKHLEDRLLVANYFGIKRNMRLIEVMNNTIICDGFLYGDLMEKIPTRILQGFTGLKNVEWNELLDEAINLIKNPKPIEELKEEKMEEIKEEVKVEETKPKTNKITTKNETKQVTKEDGEGLK